jgi:hypothetical protein
MSAVIPTSQMPDVADIKDQLIDQVFEGLGVDETLMELAQDPERKDDFEAKLMQMRVDYRDFYKVDGQIDLDALKEKLSWKEKMYLIASEFLISNIFSHFFNSNGDKATRISFKEAQEYYKAQNKGARVIDNGNIVWDQASIFSQLNAFFGLVDLGSENADAFPLPPASRMVISPFGTEHGPTYKPTMFSLLKKLCESKGLKLNLLQIGESLTPPGRDEIQLVFVPDAGLPMSADGSTIKTDELKWYYDMYKSGVDMQWMLSGPLLAAVMVMDGVPVEDVLDPDKNYARLGKVDQSFIDLLTPLLNTGKAPALPPAPEKPAEPKVEHKLPMTPDGKVDKAKLEEYKASFEKGTASWLDSYQKAGVFVLQGAPTEQALASAGVPTTDSNYATLKADLETLKS